jgi:hypothetical protein
MAVNVPRVPGVPSVLFAPVSGLLPLLTSDAASLFAGSSLDRQWGIFLGGAPVIVADTVIGFDYRQQWALSDYPVERGGFETYDKVATPFDGRLRFAAGGSAANRAALLASLEAIAGDLNLYRRCARSRRSACRTPPTPAMPHRSTAARCRRPRRRRPRPLMSHRSTTTAPAAISRSRAC